MQATTPTVFDDTEPVSPSNEARFALDSKLYVEFYRKPVVNAVKSSEAGRAVYEERDFIRIHVPGDKNNVVDRQMRQRDIDRFRDRYEKWKAGQAEAVTGTPLSALPGMTPSKVEEYKFFKIVTVEQLADANDQLGQKFMSFNQDKNRAKAFLEVAAGNAPIEHMNQELAKRDETIETLKAQVEALVAAQKGGKKQASIEA